MALTTTYGLVSLLGLDLSVGPSTTAIDVATLADGGFVGAGLVNGHAVLDYFDAGGVHTGGNISITGTGASVAGLADGSVVIASVLAEDASFSVRSQAGVVIVGETSLNSGGAPSLSVDVTSLGGNDFVIATNVASSGTFFGLVKLYRVVNGVESFANVFQPSIREKIQDVSVAGNAQNGDMIVAYTLENLGNSTIGLAVWDAEDPGSTLVNRNGDDRGTIARNPCVVDTHGFGFGIVYETDNQSDSLDVVLSLYNLEGIRLVTFDISNPGRVSQGFDETNATASMVTDTLVAVTYTQRSTATRDEPPVTKVVLYDLETNSNVASLTISSLTLTSSINPFVVGLENGHLALFATNTSTSSDGFGRLLGAERTQTGDAANDLITGDALRDHMFGGSGNDTLAGQRSADDLHGGLGNDVFRLGRGDVGLGEVLAGDAGSDRIDVSGRVHLDLATITSVERLRFFGTTAAEADLSATQFGNGALALSTTIQGRLGQSDTVQVDLSGTVTLDLGRLRLIDWQDSGATSDRIVILGDGDDELVRGSVVADQIALGSGADRLNGLLGQDTLTGGAGADRFVFSTVLGGGNIDLVTDFSVGIDQLGLNDAIFAGLSAGRLANAALEVGSAAASAKDRIIYNDQTGALFFDPDGTGAAVQVRFATLTAGLALSAGDIFVF